MLSRHENGLLMQKALEAFSVIVKKKPIVKPMDRFTALLESVTRARLCPHIEAGKSCRVVAKPPTDSWKLGGLSRVAMAVWLL